MYIYLIIDNFGYLTQYHNQQKYNLSVINISLMTYIRVEIDVSFNKFLFLPITEYIRDSLQ